MSDRECGRGRVVVAGPRDSRACASGLHGFMRSQTDVSNKRAAAAATPHPHDRIACVRRPPVHGVQAVAWHAHAHTHSAHAHTARTRNPTASPDGKISMDETDTRRTYAHTHTHTHTHSTHARAHTRHTHTAHTHGTHTHTPRTRHGTHTQPHSVADGKISMDEAYRWHQRLLKRQHFGREPPARRAPF